MNSDNDIVGTPVGMWGEIALTCIWAATFESGKMEKGLVCTVQALTHHLLVPRS